MGKGRAAVWKVLFPEKLNPDGFSTLFYEELDSWFTADIACCDACYDAYRKAWPGLAVSGKFQEGGIPLTCFHSGSSMGEIYTEEEFLDLCRKMGCPVCGEPLEHNIWVFNPDFDIPKDFVTKMEELASLSTKTPFLALRHPLARQVLREVRKLAANIPDGVMNQDLFRARPIGTQREASKFLAPPAAKCHEGRYNHAGRPVLYLASSAELAHAEIGEPKEGCFVATLTLGTPLKVLDLASEALPSDMLQAITASALLSTPTEKEGWEKPEYTFSRFVADCAMNAGFTALRYPSAAPYITRPEGFNLALFRSGHDWKDVAEIGSINEFHPKEKATNP